MSIIYPTLVLCHNIVYIIMESQPNIDHIIARVKPMGVVKKEKQVLGEKLKRN